MYTLGSPITSLLVQILAQPAKIIRLCHKRYQRMNNWKKKLHLKFNSRQGSFVLVRINGKYKISAYWTLHNIICSGSLVGIMQTMCSLQFALKSELGDIYFGSLCWTNRAIDPPLCLPGMCILLDTSRSLCVVSFPHKWHQERAEQVLEARARCNEYIIKLSCS